MSVSLCCRRFPLTINTRLVQPSRNSYIVLLPEVNPNMPDNSVLMKDNMPDFTNLTTEQCVMTAGKQLLDFEQGIRVIEQSVVKAGCTDVIKEVIEPIEKMNAPLENTWGIIKNLYLTRKKLMPAVHYVPLHNRIRRARSSRFFSKSIYNACKECDQSKLTEEEQRVVDKYVLEGRLAGLELNEFDRERLALNHVRIAEKVSDYNKKVEISSNMFSQKIHDPNITKEMPDQLLRLMAENKEEPNRGPWTVTLEPQLINMFMAYCPDHNLRENIWQANNYVASQLSDYSELRNSTSLEKIRELRIKGAQLLGYKNFADMSMETKMAGSLENVKQTLRHMLHVAKPAADREIAELQKFAWDRGFKGPLDVWDVPYWERKQKTSLFNYKEEMLNDYLPFDKVLSGLLALSERLFDIKFVENKKVDRWHPDVRFFHIYENSNKPVAGFYLDPYAREDKLSPRSRDVWVVSITPAVTIHKTLPLSTLLLQLDPPIFGKPSLLTWKDVEDLFKQFGLILQQLLSTVHYTEVTGQSNIEWDAVDIVGNVFLHWLRDPAVLESISEHYASGEKLPPLPLDEIKRHFAGYTLCEELFTAHLDLELYSSNDFWMDIMKRLWPEHFILKKTKWDSRPCNMTSIVTGQWSAAYFSHVWARMVAADVYSAFTEPDVDIKSIGERFRDTYLAFGGSCHPGEVFRRFRGRDPSSEAYLKYLGLH